MRKLSRVIEFAASAFHSLHRAFANFNDKKSIQSLVQLCSEILKMNFPLLIVLIVVSVQSASNVVNSSFNKVKVIRADESSFMRNAIKGELCNRECKHDDVQVCHFKFMIKFYQVMSG